MSVLAQSYPNIEYVVMDGGSTDDSEAILTRYSGRLAYWQSRPDGGFAEALSQGFARTSGEILAYLNSDDQLAPHAVREAVRFLEERPDVVMVYGNRLCIDAAGKLLYARPGSPFGARSRYSYILFGQESCFWRRTAFEQVGGVDTNLTFAVDYDLFSRLGRVGRVAHCGAIWGLFRRHRESKTMTSFATVGRCEVAQVQRKLWGRTAPRWRVAATQFAFRLYILGYGTLREFPPIESGVDLPRAGWADRIRGAFHNDSWLVRFVGRARRSGGR